MNDLILKVNFERFFKENNIVIEFYFGKLTTLKSKCFSGQLKKINFSILNKTNNINPSDLILLIDLFKSNQVRQISKNEFYIYDLFILKKFLAYNCIFYKTKNSKMILVEDIVNLEYECECENKKTLTNDNFNIKLEKNLISINIKKCKVFDIDNINALFYLDLNSQIITGKLFFEKNNIKYKYIKNECWFENFDYEKERYFLEILKSANFIYKNNSFTFIGKDISKSINNLNNINEMSLFTNNGKSINIATFSNTTVSYDLDWFYIDGEIQTDSTKLLLENLINLKINNHWIEINDEIIFLPSILKNKLISTNEGKLCISKKYFGIANKILNQFNIDDTSIYNEFNDFSHIKLNNNDYKKNNIRDYQETGIKWLIFLYQNRFGGCLADDMGLGKTFQIIGFLGDKSVKKNFTDLIIVPKTLIFNWKKEFEQFAPNSKLYIHHGSQRDINKLESSDIILTTYGTLQNDRDIFCNIKFNNIIIDEAQYIKNNKTNAYQIINNLDGNCKFIITGTPFENNIYETINLMKLVNPSIFLDIDITSISKNDIKMIKSIIEPFILRRLKSDVLKSFPIKNNKTIYCEMEYKQKELYIAMFNSIKKEISHKPNRYEIKSNALVLRGLTYLQQICCHPRILPIEHNINNCDSSAKMNILFSLLQEKYSNHKIIIFSKYTKILKIIKKWILSQNYNCFYLDGKTTNRSVMVDDFEKSKDGIFLISLKAGGTGLNLTSSDTVIIYDPWWNPAVEKQAEDRVYRIGQNKDVTIYRIVTIDTIEEKIEKLKHIKQTISDELLSDTDTPPNLYTDIIESFFN